MSHILPINEKRMAPAIAAREEARKKWKDEDRSAKFKETYQNPDKAAEFAAHRIESFNLTINPELIAAELFEYVPLPDDGRIQINTSYKQEYQVKEINQMGQMPQASWVLKDSVAMRDVYMIQTELVTYPIQDVIQGNINKSDEVNRDLNFAYMNKIDLDVWTLFTSIFTPEFTPNTVYRLHSRVKSANIPTTNIVDASSEGGLTVKAVKMLLDHCEKAGVKPRMLYMSVQDKSDMRDWTPVISSYAAATAPKYDPTQVLPAEKYLELWNSGQVTSMFGYPITIRTLNWLDAGKVYVATDKPSGRLYYKPGFEKTLFVSERECNLWMKQPLHEGVQAQGAIKPLIESPQYLNSVRLDIA
jgi:hypothetical protein